MGRREKFQSSKFYSTWQEQRARARAKRSQPNIKIMPRARATSRQSFLYSIFALPRGESLPPHWRYFPASAYEVRVHVHAAHRNKYPIPERPESRIIHYPCRFLFHLSLSLYTSRHPSHSHAQSHIRSFALCCPTQSIPWSFLISHRMPLCA